MATGKALAIERNEERKRREAALKNTPLGAVLGASTTSGLNAAQMGGAAGLGFEEEPTQSAVSAVTEEASRAGVARASAGNGTPDRMTAERANYAIRGAGLAGIVNPAQFTGLGSREAAQRIEAERAKRLGQVSSNTSFAFNPETMNRTKKLVDRLNFTLTDINRDPFSSKGTKTDKVRSALEVGAKEIANLFRSPEELRQARMFDPQLAQTLDTFSRLGGRVEDIEAKIPATSPGLNIITNTLTGTMPEKSDVPSNQSSTYDYLASIGNPRANQQAQQMAADELIPEAALTQQEIARQARIPQQMMDLYFGTETQMGVLQQKEMQALEEKRILEEREKDDSATLRAKAKVAIDRNNAELRAETAKIEQNRLSAKNYMTGMLAKLGALNTTGAAAQALTTVEAKYNTAVSTLETAYKFDNRNIEVSLDEALSKVENDTDTAILRLQEDLTKDRETVAKEIMKLEQAAERESFTLQMRYSEKLRARTAVHTTALKKEAEKYAREYLKTASAGIDLFSLSKTMEGGLTRASKKNAINSSYTTVKNDIKKNLPAAIATKIITELTDEEMSIFLEDYLSERDARQQSIDPTTFFEQWKKQNDINQEDDDDGFNPVYQ